MLGFAFKADTGDTRESPAITLIRDFLADGAFVNIYDPKVENSQIWSDLAEACPSIALDACASRRALRLSPRFELFLFPPVQKHVTICRHALEACKSADAVVIATEWREFREIDWAKVYADMNKPAFVFDGRLLVDVEKLRTIGFKVRSAFL